MTKKFKRFNTFLGSCWWDSASGGDDTTICDHGMSKWFDIPKGTRMIDIRTSKTRLDRNSIKAQVKECRFGVNCLHLLTKKRVWFKVGVGYDINQLLLKKHGSDEFWVTVYYKDS